MNTGKYPRTPHLWFSPGATSDDRMLTWEQTLEHFDGKVVVVTEKMDGENTTIEAGGHCHARSLDSKSHPSRDWVRALAGRIGHEIPQGWRVNGESVYARHSIAYTALPSYFMVFGMVDADGICLSWDDTVAYADILGLSTVPVLYRGLWDEAAVKACYTGTSRCGGVQEGYVVRLVGSFPMAEFAGSAAKWVRENHISDPDDHWMYKAVVPNGLAG